MKFFGLLHIEKKENTTVNSFSTDFYSNIKCYVESAYKLSESLKNVGLDFVLLTNDKPFIRTIVEDSPEIKQLTIENIEFVTYVPSGIRFYSAHFKLDVIRYLSTLSDDYVALCDLDVICTKDAIPDNFLNCINNKAPLCYDITDHDLPGYGNKALIKSISSINGNLSQGRWYGGEFISGPPDFFNELANEIDVLYPVYLNNLDSIHHVGDEAVLSAAIENIQFRNPVYDAGKLNILGRYWSARTGPYTQAPFDSFKDCFLLHLPSDKDFFEHLSFEKNSDIVRLYRKYIYSPKRFFLRSVNWFKRFMRR